MSDDLLSVLTGGKESLGAPPADPTDYLVRTVYAEADPQTDSRQAVASVIVNRSKASGKTYDQVVQEPSQFEPWGDPAARARMLALDPNSDTYKQIQADIQPVLSGKVSLPYTNFYSPSVLKARGRQAPSFDNGSGTQIGTQLFFSGDVSAPLLADVLGPGAVSDKDAEGAYDKAFGGAAGTASADAADAGAGPATIKTVNGKIVFGDTGKPVPAPQAATITTLARGGKFSADAEPGSVNLPWVQRNPNDQFKPGEFYIEAGTGQLKQVPGGAPPANAGFGGGVMAGLGDIPNSLFKLFPGHSDSHVYNAMEANRLVYDAAHQGDAGAQVGRLTGNVIGSVLPMMGAEAGLGRLATMAPEAATPIMDFLAGNAGRATVENGVRAGGNLLLRGGSLAARGAGEGAGAALLTSGASDRPPGEQIRTGATTGALLGPLLPGAGALIGKGASAARGLLEPLTESGRNKLVDRFLIDRAQGGPTTLDLTPHVPGSTPTLAQATGNPGIATVERGVKAINPTPFDAIARSNQQARELAIDAARGDRQSLSDLIAARSAQTDPLREAAFAKTTPVDPTPVVAKIDEILASPSGQRDAVVNALKNVREKLVNQDGAMQSDPEQLWGIRRAINDMLSPLAAGTKSDGRLAARELETVRDSLDPIIEGGAPGFKGYLRAYSDASKKVDAQEYLQGLNLTTADGTITLGKIDSALKRIEAARAKSGANPAKNIDDTTLSKLYAVRDDLVRQANSERGRGSGSDTYQKLATGQLMDTLAMPAALGLGIHAPIAGAAVSLGKLAYGAKNRQLLDLLTSKLIDPTLAPSLEPRAPSIPNRLLNLPGRAVVPAGAILSNDVNDNRLLAR